MRLYSDLQDSGGRRYYFNLESAPGGISPATAIINLFGYQGSIQELTEVFRTPATAVLTLFGRSTAADVIMLPAQAALGVVGHVPTLLKETAITNALPPDYTDLPENAPTLITEMTVQPARALITIASLEHAINQGGDIRIIEPPIGTITMVGLSPNYPRQAGEAAFQVLGLVPDLLTELVISPETGAVSIRGIEVRLQVPFTWVDDDPSPPQTWIDDPRA